MELEKHVVSLDLALALRENGYPQENALFYWSIPKPENASNEEERLVLANNCEVELCHKWTDWGDKFDRVAAPLASELLENKLMDGYVLGTTWFKDEERHAVCNWYETNSAGVAQVNAYQAESPYALPCYGKTLPDAAAKTWLHLRKASLI